MLPSTSRWVAIGTIPYRSNYADLKAIALELLVRGSEGHVYAKLAAYASVELLQPWMPPGCQPTWTFADLKRRLGWHWCGAHEL
jgi:hypothetical protein